MMTTRFLVLICVLDVAFVSSVLAASQYTHAKLAAAQTARAAPAARNGAALKRDLFDRVRPDGLSQAVPALPQQF